MSMKYTIPIKKDMVCASSNISVSTKTATKICKFLNRKKVAETKKFLNDLINEKVSLNGKYYTSTCKEILKVLESVESNARARGLNPDSMKVLISAHRGPTLHRGRRRWRKFGTRLKMSQIQIVLSEEDGSRKEIRKRGNKK